MFKNVINLIFQTHNMVHHINHDNIITKIENKNFINIFFLLRKIINNIVTHEIFFHYFEMLFIVQSDFLTTQYICV